MLEYGTSLLITTAEEPGERVFQPARVVRVWGDVCEAEFAEEAAYISSGIRLQEGVDLFLYREVNRHFMRQAARLLSVDQEGDRVTFTFNTTGEPVSADSRDCFRVSAVGADISATFGEETGCRVLEVSASGFSVHAATDHEVRSTVSVVLHFKGEDHSGRVVIQSARERGSSSKRYGVRCADDGFSDLEKALPGINLAIQRDQLQRLAGYR